MARPARTATILLADLDALVSAAAVAPAHPALLHCRVVVARVVVARWGVRAAHGHAVALVLFHFHVQVVFERCKARSNKTHGGNTYVIFNISDYTPYRYNTPGLKGASINRFRHKPVGANHR